MREPSRHAPGVLAEQSCPPDQHASSTRALRIVRSSLRPPVGQSHAANLALVGTETLALAWFAGTSEGQADVSIWLATRRLDADLWSPPRRIAGDRSRSEQNPVLFDAGDGDLRLYYTAQLGADQATADVRARTSTDRGLTWSPPSTLIAADARGGAFVRQPPVVLRSGRWLLPAYRCGASPSGAWDGSADTSCVLISDDRGGTWTEIPIESSAGLVQMNVREIAGERLFALFRSRRADFVYSAWGDEGGEHWSPPAVTTLPNNNSSIQFARLSPRGLVVAYNPTRARDLEPGQAAPGSGAVWGTPRSPIALAVADDGARRWRQWVNLEQSSGACARGEENRELSYPSLLQTPDGDLHVAYTRHREEITHVRIGASALCDGVDQLLAEPERGGSSNE